MEVQNIGLLSQILPFCQKWEICEFSLVDVGCCYDTWEDSGSNGDRENSNQGDSDRIRIGALVTFAPETHPSILDLLQMKDEFQQLWGQTVYFLPKESIEQSENYIRRQQILNSAIVIYTAGCTQAIGSFKSFKRLTQAEQDESLLLDILIACRRIQRYSIDLCWEQFQHCDCTLLQDAIVQQLELIGNAARKISQTTKDRHPNIPWSCLVNICECLNCEHNRAEADLIWEAIQQHIPHLIQQIELIVPTEQTDSTSNYASVSLMSESV
jgi:uncharacterized protein with HEPN domain/predicted nucleotidyltransferase